MSAARASAKSAGFLSAGAGPNMTTIFLARSEETIPLGICGFYAWTATGLKLAGMFRAFATPTELAIEQPASSASEDRSNPEASTS